MFFGSTIDLLRYKRAEIAQMGIGRKFQKPTVFEQLTVFENLELALKTDKGVQASMFFRPDSGDSDRLAEVLRTIHLADSVNRLAGTLSHGQKQWLEIGMLLMQDPKLLLLDEPVAGMTDEETARTAELFLSLKGQHSLMVVEHDMSFIKTISEKVTVLHEGSGAGRGHAGAGAGRRAGDRGVPWPLTEASWALRDGQPRVAPAACQPTAAFRPGGERGEPCSPSRTSTSTTAARTSCAT